MFGEDQTLTCRDCGQSFIFSVGEQRFYAERGFSQPARCPSCRAARKRDRIAPGQESNVRETVASGGNPQSRSGERVLYNAVCADCGQPTQVPFKPRGDRAVYCRDCYQRHRTY